MPESQRNSILEGIHFILTYNRFKFNDNPFVLQTCGTAMGTRSASSYANLFMGSFKISYIVNVTWSDNIIVYKRYINDLFFIWKGSMILILLHNTLITAKGA